MDRGRRASLRDVAAAAGVHPSTASRVLSRSRPTGPDVAERVRRAAKSLGYEVDPIGQALRRRRTRTIGLVVPDIANPFFPAVIQAIESNLSDVGLGLLLCDAQGSVSVEADRVHKLVGGRVDALLISPVHERLSSPHVRAAAERVVVVQFDRHVVADTDVVRVDQQAAMTALIEHLRNDSGASRFAFVTADDGVSTLRGRLVAYRERLRSDPASRDDVLVGTLTIEFGEETAARLLARPAGLPDAVVCANDLIAIGMIRTLRSRSVRVPDDVLVTGFDDTEMARVVEPALTTIRQPLRRLGRLTVQSMIGRLGDEEGPYEHHVLSPDLIVRGSTHRPR